MSSSLTLDPEQMAIAEAKPDGVVLGRARAGSGKCVLPGTLVAINGQLHPIEQIWAAYQQEEIFDGEGFVSAPSSDLFVDSFNEQRGCFERKRVSAIYRQNVSEIVRQVVLADGNSIELTKAHKLYTGRAWTNELASGDIIAVPRCLLPDAGTVPYAVAHFFGWFVGEGYDKPGYKRKPGVAVSGWASEDNINYSITQKNLSDLENINSAITQIAEMFGIEDFTRKIRKASSRNVYVLEFQNRNFTALLKRFGWNPGCLSAAKEVPSAIMSGDNLAVATFLQAYFEADGSISPKSRVAEVTSASRKLITQVNYLLRRLGVWSMLKRKSKRATNGRNIARPYYTLTVSGESLRVFAEAVGFLSSRKQDALALAINVKSNSNVELVPTSQLIGDLSRVTGISRGTLAGPGLDNRYGVDKNPSRRSYHERMQPQLLSLVEGKRIAGNQNSTTLVLSKFQASEVESVRKACDVLASQELNYTCITSIDEYHYTGWVYDLTVEDNHNFVAENILCHNTRVIRYRVPFILRYRDSRYQSSSKLIVNAYNKDVAAEIKTYFDETLSKDDLARVTVKTFHGIAMSMLYRYLKQTPIRTERFEIPKQGHMIQAMSDFLTSKSLASLKNGQINGLLALEGYAFARGITVADAYSQISSNLHALIGLPEPECVDLTNRLRDWRYGTGQLTFDDLLPLANALPAASFQNMRFMDVIADELQDLNFQQRSIVYNFLKYAQSFTGLGDSEQTVHEWQGASPHIFETLKKDYANRKPQEFFITTSYRCAEPIISVANQILKNELKQTVLMKGLGNPGSPVEVYDNGDVGLIQFLRQRQASGEAWKDMMVLYRTRKQAVELEMALATSDIPYILSDSSFFERAEIQDILAYFFAMYDSKPDYNQWRRVIKHQPGLGWAVAKASFDESGGDPFQTNYVPMSVRKQPRLLEAWHGLQQRLEACLRLEKQPVALATHLKSSLYDYWGEHARDADDLEDRIETVNGFIRWLSKFEGATGFDILEAVRNYEAGNQHKDPDADAVSVMTLHKSKGLEKPTVALYNVGYGSLPLRTQTPQDEAAENRLLYVGVTRAKRHLGLICMGPAEAGSVSLTRYAQSGRELVDKGFNFNTFELDLIDLLAG